MKIGATAFLLALTLAAPGPAGDVPPNLSIALPAKSAPDECFVAGELRTIEGRWIDVDPETGRNRAPAELNLMVRNTSREREVLPVVFLEDGITWRVEGVDLGSADGLAVVTARGKSVTGKRARTARAMPRSVACRMFQVSISATGTVSMCQATAMCRMGSNRASRAGSVSFLESARASSP